MEVLVKENRADISKGACEMVHQGQTGQRGQRDGLVLSWFRKYNFTWLYIDIEAVVYAWLRDTKELRQGFLLKKREA